jgi:hypothetical protein
MPITETASKEDLKRVLELFPVANLRSHWPGIEGSKEEICGSVSGQRTRKEIISFVSSEFSCCKQHVYILRSANPPKDLPDITLSRSEKVHGGDGHPQLHLMKATFSVVFKDHPESAEVAFLWPFRLEIIREHLAV